MLPTLPPKAKGFTSHHGNSLVQRGAGAVMCRHHLSPLVNKAKGGGGGEGGGGGRDDGPCG